jgi:UDP-GlcNAc:undecaprenyl-phosphate GlcNAc-1-phosphate transferase
MRYLVGNGGENVTHGLELTYVALLCTAICLFAMPIAQRLKVIDYPDNGRKAHPAPTPLVGGIAIMVPLIRWCVVRISAGHIEAPERLWVAVALCGGAVAVAGFIDDQRYVSAIARLVLLAIIAAAALAIDPALIGSHVNTAIWGTVGFPVWLFVFLVILALIGFPSAVNMADGMNGVVIALFIVWALCIANLSDGTILATARVIAIGAAVTFLFNLRGRLFLGDCGAFGVAFVLGLLTIAAHNAGRLQVETVVVWYFVPVADCFRLMASRSIAGRSPLSPDKNHFHHRLSASFGPWNARLIYVALVAFCSLIATFAPRFDAAYLAFLAIAYGVLLRPDLVGWHPKPASSTRNIAKAVKPGAAVLSTSGTAQQVPPPMPMTPPGIDAGKTLH